MTDHTYTAGVQWSGTTRSHDSYDRSHLATLGPAELRVSADEAFLGDPELPNPEQLVVGAASSCQLLSFLAVAARAGIDVVGYSDDAVGEMPEGRPPMRITRILLRPHVQVRGADPDEVVELIHLAHGQCFIANSLTSEVVLEATVEVC